MLASTATIRSIATILGLCILPYLTHADTLQLANGDRLQGHLLSREAGQIRWESPILGTVTVAESQATVVCDPANTTQASESLAVASANPPTPSASQNPTAAAAPPPAKVEKAKTSTAASHWKTTIESGIALQSGRSDRADINLRDETTFERKRNSFRVQAKYLYSKADASVTTDRTEGAFRWRRELDQRWFGQTNTSYYSSKIKGIDHSIDQNVGLGYRLIKTDRTQASIGAGFTEQYREISGADTSQSLFGEIFQDFAIKLTPRLDLGEDFVALYSPSSRGIRILSTGQVQVIDSDVTNYTHTLNAFLRGKLTATLSLALRYEYEFDNTYVSESAKADQRITTSLGYTF
jgi:putative salt-induced outer membrane protein YdiY